MTPMQREQDQVHWLVVVPTDDDPKHMVRACGGFGGFVTTDFDKVTCTMKLPEQKESE